MRRRMLAARGANGPPRRPTAGMERDLLRRVRWRNLGRASGLLAVGALVVAWPRLQTAPPQLPVDGARPVQPAGAASDAVAAAGGGEEGGPRRKEGGSGRTAAPRGKRLRPRGGAGRKRGGSRSENGGSRGRN